MAPHPGKEAFQILQSLEERSRILPVTSHTQLSDLHLKSSCTKILQQSKWITNNAGKKKKKEKGMF